MRILGLTLQQHLMAGAAIVAVASASPAMAQTRQFNVPAQAATRGIPQFARQAGVQVIASGNVVAGRRTNAVRGNYSVQEGLRLLLNGTGLVAEGGAGGIITIRAGQASVGEGQAGSAAADSEDAPGQAVTVTGSRIRGAQVPSPLIQLSQEEIRRSGYRDLGEALRALPQNFGGGQNPEVTVAAAAASNANGNATGSSAVNLRGLGPDATLTLLNGARLPYDGLLQAVDISIVPIAALDRVEILLDGASAVYGSDAVGGVVNIITNRRFEGLELSLTGGGATDGGLGLVQISGVAGHTWSDAGFIVTGHVSRNTDVDAGQRDYLSHLQNPEVDLYPRQSVANFLFSGDTPLTSSVRVTLDAFATLRRSETMSQSTTTRIEDRPQSFIWGVAPSVEISLPRDWTAMVRGFLGRNEAETNQETFSVATGARTSVTSGCYCNRAMSASIELEGPLFALPGGAARVSVGGGWRRNRFEQLNFLLGTTVAQGTDQSYFGFAQANFPIFSGENGLPLINRLIVDAAIRHERYDSFGNTTTPRVGVIWSPVNGLDFRASWGRSFKVPTLLQQHQRTLITLSRASTFFAGAPASQTVIGLFGGNPSLSPERAEIVTLGFVARPSFVPGLRVEGNWFDIDYSDRIVVPITPNSQAFINPAYVNLVTRNPTAGQQAEYFAAAGLPVGTFTVNSAGAAYNPANVVGFFDNRYTNVSSQRVSGLDLSLSYQRQLAGGQIALTANGTWILKSGRKLTDLAAEQRTSGVIFWPADFRARVGASWTRGPLAVSAFLNHISGVLDTNVVPNVEQESMNTIDMTVQVRPSTGPLSQTEFTVSVLNLFDEEPPFYQPAQPFHFNFDSTNYSGIGRTIRVGLRTRF